MSFTSTDEVSCKITQSLYINTSKTLYLIIINDDIDQNLTVEFIGPPRLLGFREEAIDKPTESKLPVGNLKVCLCSNKMRTSMLRLTVSDLNKDSHKIPRGIKTCAYMFDEQGRKTIVLKVINISIEKSPWCEQSIIVGRDHSIMNIGSEQTRDFEICFESDKRIVNTCSKNTYIHSKQH
jgi:hypothetical protein